MRSERWIIHVHERPAAVERVLGTLRRRAIHVSDLSVARASGSSLVVNVAVCVDGSVGARVTAELESSPDAIAVERMRDQPPPGGARSDNHEEDHPEDHHDDDRTDHPKDEEREHEPDGGDDR